VLTWIAPDYPLRRGVQARARASRELSRPVWVTGQSGQSKLHTAGEHSPGGPTTAGAEPDASDVRGACTTQPGPGAAGLGTSGEVGPGTDVNPAHAASEGGPCREPPILGGSGALTRGWRRYKSTCDGHRWSPQAES
jgi:hypothetical protein